METIIGLGQAGCNIADEFAKHDQYQIYKIDVDLEGLKETGYGDFPQDGIYSMPKQNSPEAYEENCPDMEYFFKDVKGEILFIVAGSGDISGAALRILQQLKNCDISVLYIQPDFELLPEAKKMQERAVYYILQEYARSAVFKRIFLISNDSLEEHIENIPLVGYYDKINEMIVSTFHMINVYNHLKPVMDTFYDPYKTARISTLGIFSIEDGTIKQFFSLDKVREMRYYYAINKNDLKTDGNLFKKVKQQVKDNSKKGTKTSYGIYSTDYEQNYGYTIGFSPSIQTREEDVIE
jgi:hypothetical protein